MPWLPLMAVCLMGFAGVETGTSNELGEPPKPTTFEAICRDPTALLVRCEQRACAFYRCRDVALPEGKPETSPVVTRGVGGMGAPAAEAPSRFWGNADDPLLHRGEPVFIIPWQQPSQPPLPPSRQAELQQRARRPYVAFPIFPAEPEFHPWFKQRGINPNGATLPVLRADAQRLRDGPTGGMWNEAWRQFIHSHPNASTRDVWSYAGELCLRFELFGPSPVAAVDPPPRPKPTASDDAEVRPVPLDPTEGRLADKALAECANFARREVLKYRTYGRSPTPAECQEQVEVDSKGVPVTLAMKLGQEMHAVALKCAEEALRKLRPDRFSIEPRYRYDRQNQRTLWLSPQEVQSLLKQGLGSTLLGTLIPDVVLHTGDPTRPQRVYDFKFPCIPSNKSPPWRQYPPGHPYKGESQRAIYKEAFKCDVDPVVPGTGVIP